MILRFNTLQDTGIEIEAQDEKQAIRILSFWQSLPSQCPICQAEIFFNFRSPKGNDYYTMTCRGNTVHESNIGVHKENKGVYYKGDSSWQKAFSNSVIDESQQKPQTQQDGKKNPNENLPLAERIKNIKNAIFNDLGLEPFKSAPNETEKSYFDRLCHQFKNNQKK